MPGLAPFSWLFVKHGNRTLVVAPQGLFRWQDFIMVEVEAEKVKTIADLAYVGLGRMDLEL